MATTTETKKADAAPVTGSSKRVRQRKKVDSMMAEPWKPENVGDCLQGIFHGVESVKGKGTRPNFKSYHIEMGEGAGMTPGKRVRVASAMLNSKLNQVPKGSYVWLTYLGLFKTDNGDSNDYEVEVETSVDLIDPLQESGQVSEPRA